MHEKIIKAMTNEQNTAKRNYPSKKSECPRSPASKM